MPFSDGGGVVQRNVVGRLLKAGCCVAKVDWSSKPEISIDAELGDFNRHCQEQKQDRTTYHTLPTRSNLNRLVAMP